MAPRPEDLVIKANNLAARGRTKAALRLYLKAGDYRGAGQMHEKLGQVEQAVECYSRGANFVRAAELLATNGDYERAARLFAKADEFRRAATAFLEADKVLEAAKMLERVGEHAEAAELFEQAGRFGHAASLYENCGMREKAISIYEENGRKELAARLCAQAGEYHRAADLYSQMDIHIEAARCFDQAGLKDEAVEAFEKADAFHQAIGICEELGRFDQVARYCERLNDTERAVEYYAKAGRFAEAGRIYEDKKLYFQAARMYLKDKSMLARAGDLFEHTFSVENGWHFKTPAQVWDIALAEKAERVVLGLANAEVVVLDMKGQFLWRFRIPMGIRCRSVAVAPDATCLAVGTEGRSVYTLDASNRLLWKREVGGEVRGLAFADDAKMIVAGCTDGYIRVFNLEGKDIWSFQTDFKVWHLAVNDEKRQIVAGTGDGQVYFFSYDGHVIWKDKADDWIGRLTFSPGGSHVAAVVGQDKVRMYDVAERSIVWEHEHDHIVQDVRFWTDDYLAVTSNSEFMVWDKLGRMVCRELSCDRVTRVQRSADSQTLYVGHFEQGLQVVKLHDCMLLAARCYEEHGDYRGAARLYRDKNELTSAAKMYRKAGDYLDAAEIAVKLGDDVLAAQNFEKASEFEKAGECYERAGMLEQAISCYDKGGRKSKAGALLADLGDTRRAAELQLESGDFLAAGKLFNDAGAAEEAIDAYERAAEVQALGPVDALVLGRLYLGQKKLDDAIKLVQPFRSDEQFGHGTARLLAECFMAKKQFGIAVDHYREALGGEQENSTGWLDILYGLSAAYESAGRYDEAIESFEKILRVDYYYRDVSGRIERIREIGSVFRSSNDVTTPGIRVAPGGSDPPSSMATVVQRAPKRYEVIRKLGEGGMGVVYEARDTKLDRIVAMKVLPSKFNGYDELKSRFLREARAVAALSHENVVAVYDIGEEWGESYIAMEFVDGMSLRDVLSKKKKLPTDEALTFTRQIVEGLAAAHRAGIVHRDIKPENVMVSKSTNQVKLMDFGLARMDSATNLTQEGSVMGTWRYMAPEQIRGDKVSPAADVYATGVMMFEMMAGRPPFNDGDLAFHHVNTEPPVLSELEPGVPEAVSEIVARCLIKNPDERIPSAQELAAALAPQLLKTA